MSNTNLSTIKIGILGGGQLGRMLINAANLLNLTTYVLDDDDECPAAKICTKFIKGSFKNYDDVLAFGKLVDVITIEIESVNTEALIKLQDMGKKVYPEPSKINVIKDKGLQKQFYKEHHLPTSTFELFADKTALLKALESNKIKLPFVQKSCRDGYDGRGVAVIKTKEDLNLLLDRESLVEELVDFEKELAVIVARNTHGEVIAYPPVEMTFNPKANLVENLISPAQIDEKITEKAQKLALDVMHAFKLTGVLAVEMFLDKSNNILINEVAPRPHNSGHHSIEGNFTSQYQQHLRAILGLPLGSTNITFNTVMINLLGEKDYSGIPILDGLEKCLALEGVNVHMYGKKETRPYRKMGHVTIIDSNLERAKQKSDFVQQTLKIKA
ncbi:MAG: 5-(carboxyamino)imidazole ribonucleotide synthase [Flavobacteriales bacterium]